MFTFVQLCINTPGSYQCACGSGFELDPADNTSCVLQESAAAMRTPPRSSMDNVADASCYASCATVSRLKKTLAGTEEKLRSVSTALKLYAFSAGAPGKLLLPPLLWWNFLSHTVIK